jgi:glycosyltransferase involved in cell wall biosynthesis
MKIVFYSHSSTTYGAPSSLLNLIEGLILEGNNIEIHVIVPANGPLVKELKKLPVKTHVIPFFKWHYSKLLYNQKRQRNPILAKIWRFKNVWQKIILNLVWFPIHLFKISRINPDIIYVNSSLKPMGIFVAGMLRKKSIWHHRETIDDVETDFFIEWNKHLLKWTLNLSSTHIYPSAFLKDDYAALINQGDENHVVYNGVGLMSKCVKNTKLPYGSNVSFGMVGRINSQKGQKNIIEWLSDDSLQADYNFRLLLYGDGVQGYIDMIKTSVTNNLVCFKGFSNKENIFKEIDFLIVNAKHESFGRVVAEAYCYGIPVIAINSGALPELITENTGFLYNNYDEFKAIIQTLKEIDYPNLSANCNEAFVSNYSIESHTRNISNILNKFIKS